MISGKTVAKNSIFGFIGHMITLPLGFFIQRCFLHYLGTEIKGIDGVISDILMLLSLAELGVGEAIIYRIYKPLVEGRKEEIAGLMKLYRFLYQIIGVIIFTKIVLKFMEKNNTLFNNIILLLYYIIIIVIVYNYYIQ